MAEQNKWVVGEAAILEYMSKLTSGTALRDWRSILAMSEKCAGFPLRRWPGEWADGRGRHCINSSEMEGWLDLHAEYVGEPGMGIYDTRAVTDMAVRLILDKKMTCGKASRLLRVNEKRIKELVEERKRLWVG